MKKIFSIFIILATLLSFPVAYADNMGVQVVSGADTDALTASLDDIKLNEEVEIEGYAIILPNEYSFEDRLGYYRAGYKSPLNSHDYYESGKDAE